MAPPAFLVAIPLGAKIGTAVAVVMGSVLSVFGYKKYTERNAPIYFLKGEQGAGKDTILHILTEAKFVTKESTKKLEKLNGEPLKTPRGYIRFFNTAGGANESEGEGGTIQAMRKMEDLVKERKVKGFVLYVFDVNVYFGKEKIKKLIELEINGLDKNYKDKYILRIIGTHKDECSVDKTQIQNLEIEFSKKIKCKIWNLKQAEINGKEIQKELFEFIED